MAGEGLGRAELELATNQAPLDKGLGEAKTKSLGFLGQVESSFKKLSGSTIGGALLQGVGLGAGLSAVGAISSAISGAVDFMGDAVQAASDLGETISKTGQVIGQEALPELEEWAEGLAEAFKLSKQQGLDAAATFAIFGKSADLSGDALVGFSTELTELAGDFASFHNTSPEEAITAIGAALRGESEPIRRFGVLLNDATLKERAFKMGLIETTTDALTPQNRVLAAHAEILAQSADAQGDAARTGDEYAGQQREIAANLANVTAEVGEKLLPVMTALMGFINDVGVPTIRFLVDAFGAVGDAIDIMTGGPLRDLAQKAIEQDEAVKALAEQYGKSFDDIKAKVEETMAANGGNFEAATATVTTELDAQRAAVDAAATAWEQRYRDMYPVVEEEATKIAAIPRQAIEAEWSRVRASAYQQVVEHAKGLLDGQNLPKVAFDAMIQLQEEAMTEAEEAAYLSGLLQDERLAAGLVDEREGVRTAARGTIGTILERLDTLGAAGYTAGQSVPDNIADGIDNRAWRVEDSIRGVTQMIRGHMPGSEPSNPNSALRGITKAFGFDEVLAKGILSEQDVVERAMGSLSRAMVPRFGSGSLGMSPAGYGGAGAGASERGGFRMDQGVHIENVNGAEPGEVERQVSQALRQAAVSWEFG